MPLNTFARWLLRRMKFALSSMQYNLFGIVQYVCDCLKSHLPVGACLPVRHCPEAIFPHPSQSHILSRHSSITTDYLQYVTTNFTTHHSKSLRVILVRLLLVLRHFFCWSLTGGVYQATLGKTGQNSRKRLRTWRLVWDKWWISYWF